MKMMRGQVLAAIGVGLARSTRAFVAAPVGSSALRLLNNGVAQSAARADAFGASHGASCSCSRCSRGAVFGLRMMSTETDAKPIKLYIGNLGWDTTTEDLQRSFQEFGDMSDCYVVADRSTGESRGFGFVSFATLEEANRAVEMMNGKEIDGRKIRVDISRPKASGGGGGGGDTDNAKLYIGNLGFDVTTEDLQDRFAAYGTLTDLVVVTDRNTGNSRGFAFATYSSPAEAKAAADALDGTELAGREMRVNISRPKVERGYGDSYGGGGYGGGYRDNYSSAPVDNTKIFVGNLGWETTTEDLQRAFSQFGSLDDCRVVTDRDTGNSRGFGFVSFKDSVSAEKAIAAMDGAEMGGREIRVNISQPKKPRFQNSYDDDAW